jgi:hypothetical protein
MRQNFPQEDDGFSTDTAKEVSEDMTLEYSCQLLKELHTHFAATSKIPRSSTGFLKIKCKCKGKGKVVPVLSTNTTLRRRIGGVEF